MTIQSILTKEIGVVIHEDSEGVLVAFSDRWEHLYNDEYTEIEDEHTQI